MRFGKSANAYRREVAAGLQKLATVGPLSDGSLVVIRRRLRIPATSPTAARGTARRLPPYHANVHPVRLFGALLRARRAGLFTAAVGSAAFDNRAWLR
ncbi:MAG TPA: hypothetical protein VNE39_20320 [Planctomycetota bacterium]|nr:hypothetical protein [Planctomycetota bacterium]